MSISNILTTNCTVVDASADILMIREVFNYFPNQFLPVMEGSEFVGVIFRGEFFRDFMFAGEDFLLASDLVSKEMVKLHLHNSLSEAKEVFNSSNLDMVPVVDHQNNLMGIVFREDLDAELASSKIEEPSSWRKVRSFLSL